MEKNADQSPQKEERNIEFEPNQDLLDLLNEDRDEDSEEDPLVPNLGVGKEDENQIGTFADANMTRALEHLKALQEILTENEEILEEESADAPNEAPKEKTEKFTIRSCYKEWEGAANSEEELGKIKEKSIEVLNRLKGILKTGVLK